MRVLGLALVVVLALTAPIAAHAVPLAGRTEPTATGPAPGIIQVWGDCGWGWHPVPASLEPVARRMGSAALRTEP